MAVNHLHLVVPGLLLMEPGLLPATAQTPALAQLLSRATVTRSAPASLADTLWQLFAPAQPAAVPAAALCWRAAGEDPPAAPCALINAIALEVGRAGLVLARVLDDSLDAAAWQTLLAELQDTAAAHGLQFVWRDGQAFVLLPQGMQVMTRAALELSGQVIDSHLPREGGLQLMQLLNEIQMQLHHSAFNASRLAAGLPAVSSLWLWGVGSIPSLPTVMTQVATDLPLLRGMALAAGAEVIPVVNDVGRWLDSDGDGDRLLLRTDFADVPAGDMQTWVETFLNFEQSCWAPLFRLLQAGKVSALSIIDPQRGLQFDIDTRAARRWRWRRPGTGAVRQWLAPTSG